MNKPSTIPAPGRYQYSYPTFTDAPQYIDIHFLTPDGQQAFVSYPQHPNRKIAQLIPVRWFDSVILCRLEGQIQLMAFLTTFLTGWSVQKRARKPLATVRIQPAAVSVERMAA